MPRRNHARRRQWTRGAGKDRRGSTPADRFTQRRMPPPPAKTSCGKPGYRDEAEAVQWLHWIVGRRRYREGDLTGIRVERRAYECNRCHKWHLTSQERRTA